MSQQFGAFTASELFCPKCNRAMPVREKLLLVLPNGELWEYLCAGCATSLGQRTVSGPAIRTFSARPAPRPAPRRPGRPPAPRSVRGLLR